MNIAGLESDQEEVDVSGVRGRLAYEISSGLTGGVKISYIEAFETRVSADLKVRFGGAATAAKRKEVQQLPVINTLTLTPSNRNMRAHDCYLSALGVVTRPAIVEALENLIML